MANPEVAADKSCIGHQLDFHLMTVLLMVLHAVLLVLLAVLDLLVLLAELLLLVLDLVALQVHCAVLEHGEAKQLRDYAGCAVT